MVPSNVKIVTATEEHAGDLAANLRQADRQEIAALCPHISAEIVLRRSVQVSPFAYSALDEQGVVAMYGIGAANVVSFEGSPWLLGADRLVGPRYRVPFLRESRAFVAWAHERFDYLFNVVDARNEASIRWLKFCGFKLHPVKPCGPHNMPFHPFDWRKI